MADDRNRIILTGTEISDMVTIMSGLDEDRYVYAATRALILKCKAVIESARGEHDGYINIQILR